MAEQNGANDEAQTETTAADVLARVDNELEATDRVELTDEEMAALGLWTDGPGQPRRSDISTKKDVDPVSWQLVDVSDVDGRDRGEYLALEIHDKQQGERYTRPYATGLGTVTFKPANVPGLDELRAAVESAAPDEMALPDDDALQLVRDGIERGHRDYADIALEGNAWAAAFDGRKLHVEPEVSRWEGWGHLFDEAGLSEDQRRAVKETGQEWSVRPNYLDTTSSFSFVCSVGFE